MHIISRETWQDSKAPEDTGKLADICDVINENLKLHKGSELILDEEINIDVDAEYWPTREEYEKLTELVEEAGFQYLTLMSVDEGYFTLRVGVRSEHLGFARMYSFDDIVNKLYDSHKSNIGYGAEKEETDSPPF